MALDAQVEAAESVVGQAVGTALQDDGGGAVDVYGVLYDWLKHQFVRQIVHSLQSETSRESVALEHLRQQIKSTPPNTP